MKFKFVIFLLLTTLIIVGCNMSNGKESLSPAEMDPKDLPDVPAFQDEITRDYLKSTDPVKEGYYSLISKTNSFTFHFPEEMVIDDTSNAQSNHYESLIFHYEDNDIAAMDEYIIHYISPVSDLEWSKDYMSRRAGQALNYDKLESDYENQYIEIAEMKPDDTTMTLAALIWNDNEQQMQIFTDIICRKDIEKDECTSLQDKEREKVIEVFKSIKFLDVKGK